MEHQFILKTKPWEHQRLALEYLFERDTGALYTKPGSGKTKVMIDLIINRGFKRVLVVAPKKPCDVWPGQFKLHAGLGWDNIVPLYKLGWEQKRKELQLAMQQPKDKLLVFIVNYESVWRRPLDRMLFYKKLGIDCVICDESHRIKSPGSKCSCFLARLGRAVPHRYVLTGTPLAENPLDVYAQYRFLDPSIFGTSYSSFCDTYTNIDPYLTSRIGHTILDQKEPYKNLSMLREKMFSCAFYMKSTVKLPKTTRMVVRLKLPSKVEALYKELDKEGSITLEEGYMATNNSLEEMTRKQQLMSGYLYLEHYEDDEGNADPPSIERVSTYRRTALYNFIKELPEEEPIVVFARFKKDLYSIRKVAERLGCGYSEVSGSEDTQKDWKQGKTRIIGVQYGSGAEGIDLTRAHLCIFYTLYHSLGSYTQALERVHRPGQESPCIYYHFVATMSSGRTIDQDMLQCWKDKKNYVDLVMKGQIRS